MMRFSKGVLKGTTGIFLGGAFFTAYYYPELRKDPLQMLFAMRRGIRVVTTGGMMAKDYLQAGENITSDTHYKASKRMLNMFCANGGPYIKLGQVFG